MPVQFLSAAAAPTDPGHLYFSGSVTSGSVDDASININASAPDVTAIGALLFSANTNVSGVTLGATIDGEAMSTLGSPVLWDSNKAILQAFSLPDPPTGNALPIVASFSGLGGGGVGGIGVLVPLIVAYSGVESVGTPVTAGGSSTTVNSVEVDSVSEAHRVVTVHGAFGIGVTNNLIADWLGVNNTLRARGIETFTTRMVLQDTPGDDTVTGTATNAFTNSLWGAIGFDLAPAIVVGNAVLQVAGLGMSPSGNVLRAAEPVPERFWLIPSEPDTLPS